MREALERVKRALGPDAVILGTRCLPPSGLEALTGRQRVEITAAPPDATIAAPRLRPRAPADPAASPSASASATRPTLPEHLYPYYVQLVQNEVAAELAESLVREASAALPPQSARDATALRDAIRARIARLIPDSPSVGAEAAPPRRLAFVGPSGSGKTTTVAKLAAHFKLRNHQRVVLLSLDTQRLGADEQLRRYAQLLDTPLYVAQTSADVRTAVAKLEPADILLVDTPGIGLREQGRFARLATLLHSVRADETQLVLPGTLTPGVQVRLAQSFAPLKPTRLVLTRLDDAIGFGVILNTMQHVNLLVSYITTGQNVPNDIERACGQRVAELLLA